MTENKSNLPDFASLFLKGVERAAELQKKSLDFAVQQNAELMASYKKGAEVVPTLPSVLELAGKAFEGFIEAQKSVIDQVTQQTAALVDTAKESGSSAQKVAGAFTKNIEQAIERSIDLQKKALELVAQQTKESSSTKRGA